MADRMGSDELALLRRLLPPRPEDPAAEARARATLMAKVASAAPERPRRRWHRPGPVHERDSDRLEGSRTPRALRLAMVTAATLLIVAGSLTVGRDASPPAEAALLALAEVAQAQPATSLSPGTYAYTRSHHLTVVELTGEDLAGTGFDVLAFQLESTREVWTGRDGTMRIRTAVERALFFDEQSAELFDRLGLGSRYQVGEIVDEVYEPQAGDLRPEDWPQDDAGLEAAMRAWAAEQASHVPVEVHMFELGASLLRETDAPPGLRSSVFSVLARLKGPETEQYTTRRTRVGITYEQDGIRWKRTLEFATDSARLVFEALQVLDPLPEGHVPAGTWVSESRYVEARVVEEPPRP